MTRRVVFVFAAAHSINFHQTALVRALRRRATTWQCFDVGQWFRGQITRQEIVAAARNADALVLHSSVFSWRYDRAFSEATFYVSGPVAPPEYSEFVDDLLTAPTSRVWIADNLDLHGDFEALGLRAEQFHALASFYFPHRFTGQRAMEDRYRDPWMQRFRAPEDGYARLTNIPVQIENPFCLDDLEFEPSKRTKLWRLTVPGVGYARRRIARKPQAWQQRATQPYILARLVRRATALNYRLTKWRLPNRWSIDFGRSLHHGIIARSESAYTEGSGYDYPVRKFVEIPAQRTLLLCTPHPGFEDRGFSDGKTHIAVAPEDVVSMADALNFGAPSIRGIVQKGHDMVQRLHHADARAAQLIGAIDLVAAGRLKSACFQGGEYVYQTE